MKIVFYSPYLPKHSGGGEKYLFDCIRFALEAKDDVYLAISSEQEISPKLAAKIKTRYENFLNYSLADLKIIATPIGTESNFIKKLIWTAQFDRFYYQTDGSLFFSLAKKNILHIQVPLKLDKSSLLERAKLANWQVKNTNSAFTKKYIEQFWRTKIDFIHHPLVDLAEFSDGNNQTVKKEKMILNVGRFFEQLHSKKQDVLVKIFAELLAKYPKETQDWQLVLIGFNEDDAYAKKVANLAKDLPIKILHRANRQKLLSYYQKASIYWHATGFGLDEELLPEKMEHFGISTIEAMAAKAVPIVINKGGQKEILTGDLNFGLWNNSQECLQKSSKIMSDEKLRSKLAQAARQRAGNFSSENFKKTLLKMIK